MAGLARPPREKSPASGVVASHHRMGTRHHPPLLSRIVVSSSPSRILGRTVAVAVSRVLLPQQDPGYSPPCATHKAVRLKRRGSQACTPAQPSPGYLAWTLSCRTASAPATAQALIYEPLQRLECPRVGFLRVASCCQRLGRLYDLLGRQQALACFQVLECEQPPQIALLLRRTGHARWCRIGWRHSWRRRRCAGRRGWWLQSCRHG